MVLKFCKLQPHSEEILSNSSGSNLGTPDLPFHVFGNVGDKLFYFSESHTKKKTL
jgi:hypothetical protein